MRSRFGTAAPWLVGGARWDMAVQSTPPATQTDHDKRLLKGAVAVANAGQVTTFMTVLRPGAV